MDGTITVPVIDFKQIRQEIGLMEEGDLAVQVNALPEKEAEAAWAVIHAHENFAKENQQLQPGFMEVVDFCRQNGVRTAILTRNLRHSVDALCNTFELEFDCILTREFEFMKPHPAPILHIVEQLQVSPERTLMVGDYVHDIECGRRAGTDTCFIHNQGHENFGHLATFSVKQINEIIERMETKNV